MHQRKILKIGQYLTKIWKKICGLHFLCLCSDLHHFGDLFSKLCWCGRKYWQAESASLRIKKLPKMGCDLDHAPRKWRRLCTSGRQELTTTIHSVAQTPDDGCDVWASDSFIMLRGVYVYRYGILMASGPLPFHIKPLNDTLSLEFHFSVTSRMLYRVVFWVGR